MAFSKEGVSDEWTWGEHMLPRFSKCIPGS